MAQPAPRRPDLRPPRRAARPAGHFRAIDLDLRKVRVGTGRALADTTTAGPTRDATLTGEARQPIALPAMSETSADSGVRPFRIDVPRADLDDLRERLRRTRWPDQLGDGWAAGVPVDYLRDLTAYWATGYDWRRHEARLNEFPQFTAVVDGQLIHFLHVRSPEPGALPLIVTHGWPGSVV